MLRRRLIGIAALSSMAAGCAFRGPLEVGDPPDDAAAETDASVDSSVVVSDDAFSLSDETATIDTAPFDTGSEDTRPIPEGPCGPYAPLPFIPTDRACVAMFHLTGPSHAVSGWRLSCPTTPTLLDETGQRLYLEALSPSHLPPTRSWPAFSIDGHDVGTLYARSLSDGAGDAGTADASAESYVGFFVNGNFTWLRDSEPELESPLLPSGTCVPTRYPDARGVAVAGAPFDDAFATVLAHEAWASPLGAAWDSYAYGDLAGWKHPLATVVQTKGGFSPEYWVLFLLVNPEGV